MAGTRWGALKAAATMKARRKAAKREAVQKKPVEGVHIAEPEKITPYPRFGAEAEKFGFSDKEFEAKLGIAPAEVAPKAKIATEEEQAIEIKIIADFLKLPFAFWASRLNLPALRLSNSEATQWAEPTKTLLDYYLPKLPTIAYAWFAWSVTTCSIMNTRFELIGAERKKKEAEAKGKSVRLSETAEVAEMISSPASPSPQGTVTNPLPAFAQGQGAEPYKPKHI